jgi:hypothetical protein
MRKIFKYVLLVLTLSVLVASCKKPDEEIVVKSNGEVTGEELKKSSYEMIQVYLNGDLLVSDFNYKIEKQYIILPNNNGNYYKFDLNKLIYYKLVYGETRNLQLSF